MIENKYIIKMTEAIHRQLNRHLFPGDNKEAVAFALCGKNVYEKKHSLLVHEVFCLPYENCERDVDFVTWKPQDLEDFINKGMNKELSLVKFHSHPAHALFFSETDDFSDRDFFSGINNWYGEDRLHGSIVMIQNGSMIGRVILPNNSMTMCEEISVIGNNITSYRKQSLDSEESDIFLRNIQAFGLGTFNVLQNMKIAIVGCSGTGSPTIEQLVRLGVGTLVLVDPDVLELKNLNRIIGSTKRDALVGAPKVTAIKNHIENIDIGTNVKVYQSLVQEDEDAFNDISDCDVIFGCVDSAEGRFVLNSISTHFLIPFIDMGVQLKADDGGGISSICGQIHYVYPGSSTLLERKVFTSSELEEESLLRDTPEIYEERKKYFTNKPIESPAVISLNMLASSLAVTELLARLHLFRFKDNRYFNRTGFTLGDNTFISESVGESKDNIELNAIGLGDHITYFKDLEC